MSTTTEANKNLIRGLLAEVDRGNDDVVHTHYSPAYLDHARTSVRREAGREGLGVTVS